MARVSGTMPSLSRGVSQQPNDQRVDGQVGEQVNMWSDPVHGLTRRRGTKIVEFGAAFSSSRSYWSPTITDNQRRVMNEYYGGFRTISYVVAGEHYRIFYPSKTVPVDTATQMARRIFIVKDKERPATIEPDDWHGVEAPILHRPGAGTAAATSLADKEDRGFAAAVQLGDYVFFYPNNWNFTVGTETNVLSDAPNLKGEVTIHVGSTARKYTMSLVINGITYTYTYETPTSSYPGTLDTTYLVPSNYNSSAAMNEYQKKVNDRVNAYNAAVTQWIATSARESTPKFIAQRLYDMTFGNFASPNVSVVVDVTLNGPHLGFIAKAGNVLSNVTATDDSTAHAGSLITATWLEVQEQSELPTYHYGGKIIKIKPKDGADAYYMKAVAKASAAFGPVEWVEAAGEVLSTIANPMAVLGRKQDGTLYLFPDVVTLRSAVPEFADLPDFGNRKAGDSESNPAPQFFNKQVTHMGYFQDRLVICNGNHVSMSRTGGYFDFFRTTILSLPDSDPLDVFAMGSEDDTITDSVIFDKSLLLFGDRQQYAIDGRIPITPQTSSIIQTGAVEDATDCPPISAAGSVFFAKRRESSTEVFQIEVGDVADTSRYTGLGLQLSDYLKGSPSQLLYVASPSMIVCKTVGDVGKIYIYRFIDQGGKRILESWSTFDYGKEMGHIIGMWYYADNLYYVTLKHALPDKFGNVASVAGYMGWVVVERQSLLPQVANYPYLDSQYPLDLVYNLANNPTPGVKDPVFHTMPPEPGWNMAWAVCKVQGYNNGQPKANSQWWLHGGENVPAALTSDPDWDDIQEQLPGITPEYIQLGRKFDAYVELSNPRIQTQNGQTMTTGRLTVNSLVVAYKDSSGFSATVKSRYGLADQYNGYNWSAKSTQYGVVTALRFNGRRLDVLPNMINVIPVTTGAARVFIGRASTDYTVEIHANDWLPLSINRVDWHGQFFMNHRRV